VAGGAREVLLGHHCVEDAQQVQVKRKKTHGDPFGTGCGTVYRPGRRRRFPLQQVYPISIHNQYKYYQ
jgi:hypothetical protein